MRISFVLSHGGLSGVTRVVAAYATRLRGRGHDVAVVSWSPYPPQGTVRRRVSGWFADRWAPVANGTEPSHLDRVDVTRIVIPPERGITAADVPDGDILIATSWETAEEIAALPPTKGTRIFFVHNHEVDASVPLDRIEAAWRLPMRKVVTARWLADLARYRFGDRHVAVVPNAVDTSLFHADPRDKRPTPTVGMMISPSPFKGCDLTLLAFAEAKLRVPGLRLLAFGQHRPAPPLKLPHGTEFTERPAQERIREVYASCDAWLFGSRTEGFGLPILEAMACRTPVIATPAGAAPDLLANGGGELVHPEHPQSMATAIVRIAHLPAAQWRAMSDQAYNIATAYTWDDAVLRFEAAVGIR
jgi:glycosyltransferase involved in cell wall biosynthesis